jgi:hypothetical protein
MTIENIRDTGRNSARTVDVRVLAEKIQKPSDTEAVVATNVITAAESGTRFVMNVAAAKVSTLPAPAAGLEYWFYVGATEPTGTHTIVTASSANIIVGNIDADTISLVASKAVHGDFVHVWSDGTNWYLSGQCKVQDGITTTQAG